MKLEKERKVCQNKDVWSDFTLDEKDESYHERKFQENYFAV